MAVLDKNTLEGLVIPAQGLYPHRVLWDSCFIAIGLSNYDLKKAKRQISEYLKAQWSDGMVPHIIFNPQPKYWWDRHLWRSYISPNSVKKLSTSGLTQPPMLAEAVTAIGFKLPKEEKQVWYESNINHLIRYHAWLYENRDPKGDGLITLIHPWETGLDNTPPWLVSLRHQHAPWWINLMTWLKLDKLGDHLRVDNHYVDYRQRSTTIEALRLYDAMRLIRKAKYSRLKVLNKPTFAVADLAYNSIFIRANTLLRQMAEEIGIKLPSELLENMKKSEQALEKLWDSKLESYFSQNVKHNYLLLEDSVSGLLPLYSGVISPERAKKLVEKIKDSTLFNTKYPLPSVPINSKWFKPMRYWQGPTWLNINWLVINGLKQYGFSNEAERLRDLSIELVEKNGFYEYFNPLDGTPAGVKDFSWTAALIIDLIETES